MRVAALRWAHHHFIQGTMLLYSSWHEESICELSISGVGGDYRGTLSCMPLRNYNKGWSQGLEIASDYNNLLWLA